MVEEPASGSPDKVCTHDRLDDTPPCFFLVLRDHLWHAVIFLWLFSYNNLGFIKMTTNIYNDRGSLLFRSIPE
jgi:hypothetical protein